MSVDELLAPVSDAAPAGEDLSYDGERQAIESAFDAAAQGEEVDWRETVRLIEAQSARTKDLWLAVYLARAGARLGDLTTVERGCAMLAGLFERYWDSVHPQVAEYGLPGRKAPCESLTRIGEFLGPLRRVVLVEHPRLGRYSAADFERFAADGTAADGYGLFRAGLDDLPAGTMRAALDRLDAIGDALRRADSALTLQADAAGETGTNFQPAYDAIGAMRAALVPFAGSDAGEEAAPEASEAAATPAAAGRPGRIDTREDVGRALDAIADYYRRHEPSSPIPVALARVKGWIGMDFLAILRDIAPGGVNDAGAVLLSRTEESSGNSSDW
jgi:type VI secretion system ImpA family protein